MPAAVVAVHKQLQMLCHKSWNTFSEQKKFWQKCELVPYKKKRKEIIRLHAAFCTVSILGQKVGAVLPAAHTTRNVE